MFQSVRITETSAIEQALLPRGRYNMQACRQFAEGLYRLESCSLSSLSLPCLIYLRRSKSHKYLLLFQPAAVQLLLNTSCCVNPHASSTGTTTFRSVHASLTPVIFTSIQFAKLHTLSQYRGVMFLENCDVCLCL